MKNNFLRILESTYLCIRFPFLYPRNRFDGEHHVNLLGGKLYHLRKKCMRDIQITAKLEKQPAFFPNEVDLRISQNAFIELNHDRTQLSITVGNHTAYHNLNCLLWNSSKFTVLGISTLVTFSGDLLIKVHVATKDPEDKANYGFRYERETFVTDQFKFKLYRFMDKVNKLLDKVLFIPTFTELDALDTGWRKRFGIQMCKDIKKQLKKDKILFKWRITQIKEKFGSLRLYCNFASDDLYKIIDYYESLSEKTCIVCGKPAKYITPYDRWRCPYCEDHIDKTIPKEELTIL